MTRRRVVLGLGSLLLATSWLAACDSTTKRPDRSRTAGDSGGQGIQFQVTVDFTGVHPLQGSFTDDDHGGDVSCAAFATTDTPVTGWIGPQPPVNRLVNVNGQSLNYGLLIGHDRFRGPATYTGSVMSGLTIGSDTFSGKNSSVTINGDGSGSATLTDARMLSRGSGSESGTIRWTCSPAAH